MLMPERKYSADGSYRYGFNGKENDNEVKGEGEQQDYGMRIYDPRLGRFLSVDPIAVDYPWYTPYQFAGNKPIQYLDLDGLEEAPSKLSFDIHKSFNFDPTKTKREEHEHASQTAGMLAGLVGTSLLTVPIAADILITGGQITTRVFAFYYSARLLGNLHHNHSKNPELEKERNQELKATVTEAVIVLGTAKIAQVITSVTFETGKLVFKSFDARSIRFSQKTVNGEKIDDLISSMSKEGWKGEPIDIVKMEDNIYTTFDNKRLLAAELTGTEIKANAHLYSDKLDDAMKLRIKEQYGVEAETWGDAIKLRVKDQGNKFSKGNENGKFTVPKRKYKTKEGTE